MIATLAFNELIFMWEVNFKQVHFPSIIFFTKFFVNLFFVNLRFPTSPPGKHHFKVNNKSITLTTKIADFEQEYAT